jgi:hypothetical protein
MDVQVILEEIEERIGHAQNWDNHEVIFALVNLYEWIKENK